MACDGMRWHAMACDAPPPTGMDRGGHEFGRPSPGCVTDCKGRSHSLHYKMCLSCNVYGFADDALFCEIMGVPLGAVVSLSSMTSPLCFDKGALWARYGPRLLALLNDVEASEFRRYNDESGLTFAKVFQKLRRTLDPGPPNPHSIWNNYTVLPKTPLWKHIRDVATAGIAEGGVMSKPTGVGDGVEYWLVNDDLRKKLEGPVDVGGLPPMP